jgi:hypothetical protein
MVVYEICSQQLPYSEYSLSKSRFMAQFEDAICNGLRPTPPKGIPNGVEEIMKSCWGANPDRRPSATQIKPLVDKIYKAEMITPTPPLTVVHRFSVSTKDVPQPALNAMAKSNSSSDVSPFSKLSVSPKVPTRN